MTPTPRYVIAYQGHVNLPHVCLAVAAVFTDNMQIIQFIITRCKHSWLYTYQWKCETGHDINVEAYSKIHKTWLARFRLPHSPPYICDVKYNALNVVFDGFPLKNCTKTTTTTTTKNKQKNNNFGGNFQNPRTS